MAVSIREAQSGDAAACGRIVHAAFSAIAAQHNFPSDFPSVEVAADVVSMLIAHPGFYGIVAEQEGKILGSNFVDMRSTIGGIGPIAIDPLLQNKGIGQLLMRAVLERAAAKKMPGIRLVQDAYHNRSLSLYTRLGFVTREPLSLMQGQPLKIRLADSDVRPAREADLDTCNALCRRVHGFDRSAELQDAIGQGTAAVVEHLGRVTGYATQIGFFAHAIGENNEDLKALIAAAPAFAGPGFLVPTRNHDLFDWCLQHRLRLVRQATLMTVGLYNEPAGAYLPSISY
jgi:predicted N-acetyltransferase YhbS